MKYEKAMVEVVVFNKNQEFLVFSPTGAGINDSNVATAQAKARARAAMGWDENDSITVIHQADGTWIAYCAVVGTNPYRVNEMCTSF